MPNVLPVYELEIVRLRPKLETLLNMGLISHKNSIVYFVQYYMR